MMIMSHDGHVTTVANEELIDGLLREPAAREVLRKRLSDDLRLELAGEVRESVRQELMSLINPEPGAFEAMDLWMLGNIDNTEALMKRHDPRSEAYKRLCGISTGWQNARTALHEDKPNLVEMADALRDVDPVTLQAFLDARREATGEDGAGWWVVNEYEIGSEASIDRLFCGHGVHPCKQDAEDAMAQMPHADQRDLRVEPYKHGQPATHMGPGLFANALNRLLKVTQEIERIAAAHDWSGVGVVEAEARGADEEQAEGIAGRLLSAAREVVETWRQS